MQSSNAHKKDCFTGTTAINIKQKGLWRLSQTAFFWGAHHLFLFQHIGFLLLFCTMIHNLKQWARNQVARLNLVLRPMWTKVGDCWQLFCRKNCLSGNLSNFLTLFSLFWCKLFTFISAFQIFRKVHVCMKAKIEVFIPSVPYKVNLCKKTKIEL